MSDKTCFERVQMKDGSFALCKVSYTMVNGDLRITGIVEEVGVRRDADGTEVAEAVIADAFLSGLPHTQGLTVGVGTRLATKAALLAQAPDPLVTVRPSPRTGKCVITRTKRGGFRG